MRKIKDNGKFKIDKKIEELIGEVDPEHMDEEQLEMITEKIMDHFASPSFVFYFVGVPYHTVEKNHVLKIDEIDYIDSLRDENGESVPIVFTNIFHLKAVKPRLKKNEYMYAIDTKEFLEFMIANQFMHAIVDPDTIGMMLARDILEQTFNEGVNK